MRLKALKENITRASSYWQGENGAEREMFTFYTHRGRRRAVRVRTCEKLARQAKPPVPPSSQTLRLQAGWDSRFRLSGRTEANFSHLLSNSASGPNIFLPQAARG